MLNFVKNFLEVQLENDYFFLRMMTEMQVFKGYLNICHLPGWHSLSLEWLLYFCHRQIENSTDLPILLMWRSTSACQRVPGRGNDLHTPFFLLPSSTSPLELAGLVLSRHGQDRRRPVGPDASSARGLVPGEEALLERREGEVGVGEE